MKKELNRTILLSVIISIVIAIIKLFIDGGTFLEYNLLNWGFDLLYITISGGIIGYYFAASSDWKRLIGLIVISGLLLGIYNTLRITVFGSLDNGFLIISSIITYVIIILVLTIIFGLISVLVGFILNRKKTILKIISTTIIWILFVFFLINDMIENINLGGPNGEWYLYGDLILLIGYIIILVYGLIKNGK